MTPRHIAPTCKIKHYTSTGISTVALFVQTFLFSYSCILAISKRTGCSVTQPWNIVFVAAKLLGICSTKRIEGLFLQLISHLSTMSTPDLCSLHKRGIYVYIILTLLWTSKMTCLLFPISPKTEWRQKNWMSSRIGYNKLVATHFCQGGNRKSQ